MHTTIEGIVLRCRQMENDRLLTILTAELGLITAWANNTSSRYRGLAAATEAFGYCRFELFSSRGRMSVDKADPIRLFHRLRADYLRVCLAYYFTQLAGELLTAGEQAAEPLRLLLNCLHYLEEELKPPELIKPLFELRLGTLIGFMPDLVGCKNCREYQAVGFAFFPFDGRIICADCLLERPVPGGMQISPGVLAAMRHIIYSPTQRLFAFTLGGEWAEELLRVCEGFLLARAERGFSALELYNSERGAR